MDAFYREVVVMKRDAVGDFDEAVLYTITVTDNIAVDEANRPDGTNLVTSLEALSQQRRNQANDEKLYFLFWLFIVLPNKSEWNPQKGE